MEGMLDLPLWSDPIPQLTKALQMLEARPADSPGKQVSLQILRQAIKRRKANPQPGDTWPS